ncbi:MAG TPA: decarboxylating 6-phosphogluconate dehydrogenase [Verrucomicrobiae bacterium]|jgi:6-phosphogluconate dehydrogenase|nr:decarboxylating 6-phosphogluconate dehydrogenase [Verrucomicrobiae bacterium]
MELGMIGLGRMGANMTERLVRGGHRVIAYDRSREAVQRVAAGGAVAVDSLADFVAALRPPRAVWLMVPSGKPVDDTIAALKGSIERGDAVIDGGNSNYKDTMRRADELKAAGVDYIDSGTSGGIWGLKEGYSLMIGGERAAVERLTPIFQTLAPAPDRGWGHVGPSGAGHFVKMVHNGIEYGLMQAYAEGFALMQRKKEFNLDLPKIAEIWRHGSVVRSWLLDLIADGLKDNPALAGIKPYVEDSGEGRWTAFEAIDRDLAAPVITLALMERLRSRDADSFADKLLAMMRHEFGGHAIKKD